MDEIIRLGLTVWLVAVCVLVLVTGVVLVVRWFRKSGDSGMFGSEVLAALQQDGWVLDPGPPTVLANDMLQMRVVRGSRTIGDSAGEIIRFMRGPAENRIEVYRIHCPAGEVPDTPEEGEILSQLRQWGFR